jgi:hypothetical protein
VGRNQGSGAERHRNPFTWRLAELGALHDDPAQATRCRQLADELIAAEANELGQGLRHLSVVHGDPATQTAAQQVATFVRNVDAVVPVGWWTLRIGADHLIITVAGDGADDRIRELGAVADLCNPGHWQITYDARPDLDRRR